MDGVRSCVKMCRYPTLNNNNNKWVRHVGRLIYSHNIHQFLSSQNQTKPTTTTQNLTVLISTQFNDLWVVFGRLQKQKNKKKMKSMQIMHELILFPYPVYVPHQKRLCCQFISFLLFFCFFFVFCSCASLKRQNAPTDHGFVWCRWWMYKFFLIHSSLGWWLFIGWFGALLFKLKNVPK